MSIRNEALQRVAFCAVAALFATLTISAAVPVLPIV